MKRLKIIGIIAGGFVIVVACLLFLSCQSSRPSISGYVKTPDGEPVSEAIVYLEIPCIQAFIDGIYVDPQDMGEVNKTTTDKKGYFCFIKNVCPNYPNGYKYKHRITISAVGFDEISIDDIELTPEDSHKRLDVVLKKKK